MPPRQTTIRGDDYAYPYSQSDAAGYGGYYQPDDNFQPGGGIWMEGFQGPGGPYSGPTGPKTPPFRPGGGVGMPSFGGPGGMGGGKPNPWGLRPPQTPQPSISGPFLPTSIPQTQTGGQTGGGPMGGNLGHYNIGIKSGHLPDSLIEQSSSALRAPAPSPAFPNVTPEQQQALSQQFQDSMRAGTMAADIDLRRDAAESQSDLNLRRQMAMASAGLGAGNLLARLNETNLAGQAPLNSLLLNLLMGSV